VEQRESRDFEGYLDRIREDSTDGGRLELIVRRPTVDEREVLAEATLDEAVGLVGDGWAARGSRSTPDGSADPDAQLTVMSTRVLEAIEPDRERWPLAGDQLYVDFDLSLETLPAGSRLAIGTAVIEVSETPHTGCAKFSARFGSDALRWINSPVGRAHRMRGLNARIVAAGTVRTGDAVRRVRTRTDGSPAE
jgi:MOSC domain-containing protein YiiM